MSLTIRLFVRLLALATGIAAALPGGDSNPAERNFSQSVISLDPAKLALADSFTPANWEQLHKRDFDIGAAPTAFLDRNREYGKADCFGARRD